MSVMAPALSRPQAIATARRMHAGEWNVDQIRRYLNDRGVTANWRTVKAWIDPEYHERVRAAERKRMRERYRRINGVRHGALRVITDVEKMARLTQLRAAGLSQSGTAIVLSLDFDDEITEHQVRHAERSGLYPAGRKGRRKATA